MDIAKTGTPAAFKGMVKLHMTPVIPSERSLPGKFLNIRKWYRNL